MLELSIHGQVEGCCKVDSNGDAENGNVDAENGNVDDFQVQISRFESSNKDDDLFMENVDLDVDECELNKWMGTSTQGLEKEKKRKGVSVGSLNKEDDLEDLEFEVDVENLSYDESLDDNGLDKNPKYNAEVDRGKYITIEIGKEYPDHKSFREQLQQYALVNGFDYIFVKNEKARVTAICKEYETCEWRIHASWNTREIAFMVKTFQCNHSCEVQFYNSKVTAKWIAREFFEQISDDPLMLNATLQKLIKRHFNVHALDQQCYRAKRIVQSMIYGDETEQYRKLANYCEAVKKFNPGSTALVITNDDDRFQRIYICLDACKQGFRNGCRPIIGLDACHLKVYQTSQLFAAVGVDANDNIFPIAYGICERENGETSRWFLENLLKDIGDWKANKWVFISDQQKGLEVALEDLMPGVDHQYCVRHLYNNFKKHYRGGLCKKFIWIAATGTTRAQYAHAMQELENLCPEAVDWLYRIPIKTWCRHAFSIQPRCAILLNNLSESFNAYIRKVCDKPILVLLETIRRMLMTRFLMKREGMKAHSQNICPRILKKLAKNKVYERDYIAKLADVGEFEVEHISDHRAIVNLQSATCTCNGWQLTGIPCVHACAAIVTNRQRPKDFVMNCYSRSTFLNIYSSRIRGIPSSDCWPQSSLVVKPPIWKRPSGRPKKQRIREVGEKQKFSRKNNGLRCGRCREWGHNMRTCKGPAKSRKKFKKSGDNVDSGDKQKQAIKVGDWSSHQQVQGEMLSQEPPISQNQPYQADGMRIKEAASTSRQKLQVKRKRT